MQLLLQSSRFVTNFFKFWAVKQILGEYKRSIIQVTGKTLSVAKRLQINAFATPLLSVPDSYQLNPNGTTFPLMWVEEVRVGLSEKHNYSNAYPH